MDEFLAKMYGWKCTDCDTAVTLVRVGVTSRGELIAAWFCAKCKRRVICCKPLEEIIAEVPSEPQKLLEAAKDDTAKDASFLKEMHITWPSD